MKKTITLLMILFACVFTACEKEATPPEGIKPFPFGTEEAELSRRIESPSFPKLKEGHIISWYSTYDEVLNAISDTEGYTIDEYPSQDRDYVFIEVRATNAISWDFYYNTNNTNKLLRMRGGSNLSNAITKKPSITKRVNNVDVQYFLYGNTIIARAVAPDALVSCYPRSMEVIDKYELNQSSNYYRPY